jgi:signal transduction histidine kinase
MKGMMKILPRYVASAAGVALVLLIINIGVFTFWIAQARMFALDGSNVSEIADNLVKVNGVYELSGEGKEAFSKNFQWAMLLDVGGSVVWSKNLPADLPRKYSAADVASFTRWYLMDYPVYTWRYEDGLFVVGFPKNSLWKIGLQVPQRMMDSLPECLVGGVIINCIAAVLLALMFGVRLIRSLQPLARGIEDMAEKKPVALSTGGLLGDLADKLNQTSIQLQKQEAALQKRDTARTTWIAGVSHDIRTPLSMVMGYASQLEENADLPPADREQAGIIRRQSEKIKMLVSDLNLASKLEYDMQPLRMTSVSPAELARSVVADFINNGLDDHYSIRLNVEKEAQRTMIHGDEDLLKRAVTNLMDNSIRHNPDGCAINVIVQNDYPHCVITIADNGVGFSREMMETIINTEDPSVLRSHGLGLTIVRQIVKAHGGRVEYNNLAQTGCSAVIRLPLG